MKFSSRVFFLLHSQRDLLPDAAKAYFGFIVGGVITRVTEKSPDGSILLACVVSRLVPEARFCEGPKYFRTRNCGKRQENLNP